MTFLPLYAFTDALGTAGLGFPLVIVVLAGLMLFVKVLSLILRGKPKKEASTEKQEVPSIQVSEPETVVSEAPVENALLYTPGYVTLDGVAEQDAAVIMAITSENTGIPLERLCFKSIRRLNQDPVLENIEEQDAAVLMALVSHKTGIPLDKLTFNSIRLVEE